MIRIQLLDAQDLPGVARIEQLCFPNSPWSEKSLQLLCRENGTGIVAREDGQVVAYAGMTYAADEGSVTNIATHPDARRRGLGMAVTQALVVRAEALGLAKLYLEVRPGNTAAISLYRKAGFSLVGRRKNFYQSPREDALILCRILTTPEAEKKDRSPCIF